MAEEQAYQGVMDLHSGGSPLNAMDFVVRQILGSIATATLVQIKAVDTDAATVDAQPMIHQVDGHRNVVPHGVIHGMPYVRLQGGSCAVIIDPQPGDIGLAVFASSDFSAVQANKAPSPPGSLRRFNWSDGVYIGGLLNGTPKQYLRISDTALDLKGTGTLTITTDGTIRLSAPMVITTEALAAGNGWTGTFTTQDGRKVTVANGIVTGAA